MESPPFFGCQLKVPEGAVRPHVVRPRIKEKMDLTHPSVESTVATFHSLQLSTDASCLEGCLCFGFASGLWAKGRWFTSISTCNNSLCSNCAPNPLEQEGKQ